jgi:LemA protein
MLVKAIQGYTQHEQKTLNEVIEKRDAARYSTSIKEKQNNETSLTEGLKHLFALAESYPELKADSHFIKLQENLSGVETDLQNARRYYNATVRDYNTALHTIPSSWIGQAMSYRDKSFFEINDFERENVL